MYFYVHRSNYDTCESLSASFHTGIRIIRFFHTVVNSELTKLPIIRCIHPYVQFWITLIETIANKQNSDWYSCVWKIIIWWKILSNVCILQNILKNRVSMFMKVHWKKTEIYRLWKNTTVTIKTGKAIIRQAGLHCGYLCNKHVAIAMDLLTRFSKLCFACTYINIVFFFFFLGTTGQDSKKSLRRISQILFFFFLFLPRYIHPLQRIRTSRDL